MKSVIDLQNITKTDSNIAGGKGTSLGEMIRAGIIVPPGFVVLSSAFDNFITENNISSEIDAILNKLDHRNISSVNDASAHIQALIIKSKMSSETKNEVMEAFNSLNADSVAVRSSATLEDNPTATWAGQLDTYLNISSKDLFDNIKKCWASLFSPRSIFYRFEKQFHKEHISIAVVIQKMVQSDSSGIAFSVNPVSKDRNQMIIEAGIGLGDNVVSGKITPDSYAIQKDTLQIIDRKLSSEKQILSDEQVKMLSNDIVKIENHYQFPVDIEWAIEKDNIFFLQSRPITTLQ